MLYDVEGYDYQEIADMTHVSLGTVKSRIHRGRLALRDLLGADMELLAGLEASNTPCKAVEP